MRSLVCSALVLSCLSVSLGCKAGPPVPGSAEFRAANQKIGAKNGLAGVFGNTDGALAMATEFSDQMGKIDKVAFTGHKKRTFSLTGEQFLTYCHVNGDQVVFLVHVPQFKAYKSDVREELISLSWEVATTVVKARPGQFKQLGIGLRGSVMYGGLAIGELGSETPETENAAIVRESKLYRFFATAGATSPPEVVTP